MSRLQYTTSAGATHHRHPSIGVVAAKWRMTLVALHLRWVGAKNKQTTLLSQFSEQLCALTFSCVEPLLVCRRLEELRYDLPLPIAYTDQNITTLAKELPNLRQLWFMSDRPYGGNKPRTTVRSLATLASHLLKLRTISLDLDFRDMRVTGGGVDDMAYTHHSHLALTSAVTFFTTKFEKGHARSEWGRS